MRITLTLDDDVAMKIASASRAGGMSVNEVVNVTLRRGLPESKSAARQLSAFVVQPQRLGRIKLGITLDKSSAVLEMADGWTYR